MLKFDRKDLTKIQIRERANRKHNRIKEMYGLPTPVGTKPRAYIPSGEMCGIQTNTNVLL